VSFNIASRQSDLQEWEAIALDGGKGDLYARNSSNPTALEVEQRLKCLEKSEAAVSYSSGMAAISNVLFTLLKPNSRALVGKDTYGGAHYLFSKALPNWGVNVSILDSTNTIEFEEEIRQGCDLVYLESPSNPLLKIQDIKKIAQVAHEAGAIVVIDNTVATPINQNPIELGVDVVIHSATKFLGGHADALGGIACTSKDIEKRLLEQREIFGACLDPMSAYLINRGLRTLDLRLERHNKNAMSLAQWLDAHPNISQVFYPGLPNCEGHALATAQMKNYGGLLSFVIKGGHDRQISFFNTLKNTVMAATLGSVETMVGTPSTTSHVECTIEERKTLGIPNNLVRCSVGLEPIDDIIADFEQALR
jgi:cystathionine gamma-synthase